ncbi:MAG: hypothetical protein FD143_829 [Ignavibacteria bacterium]|nr:MAG: hypothetical protein FD143_829 [Ignavibacteria bacterium]KAF0160585.1 MAG: hypothetical protein FD188_1577 [Ignavibacteria bacterium]
MDNLSIIKALKKHLQDNFGSVVKDVILFGSRAAGTAVDDSDYDVLIVLTEDYNWRDENKILDLCYDMNLKYDILIDAHFISQKGLSTLRGKQPIFVNAIKFGLHA